MASVSKNFLYQLLITISNILIPIISFPYAAKILGPTGIGKVNFILTFSQYFVLIGALGIPIYGMQEVAKFRGEEVKLKNVASELFFLHLISALLLLVIYLVVINSFTFFNSDLSFYLCSGLMIFFSFSATDWFYSGMENFRFIAIRSLMVKLLGLVALLGFVRDKGDLLIYLLIFVGSSLANQFWNFIDFRKYLVFNFKDLQFKKHLPLLAVLFSVGLSTTIYAEMDTLLLGFLTDNRFVGYYVAAIKLNKIAIPVIIAFGLVLIPKITQSFYRNDHIMLNSLSNQSFHVICFIGIPASLGLCIYAPEFMLLFSGKEFSPAVLTMQIASPLAFIIGMGNIAGAQLLIPAKKEKYYLWATIFGLGINVLLNFLLISYYQDRGAAVAAVCGEFVVSFVAGYFVWKKLKIKFKWQVAIKALISSFCFFPISYILRRYTGGELYFFLFALLMCMVTYFIIQCYFFRDEMVATTIKKIKIKIRR